MSNSYKRVEKQGCTRTQALQVCGASIPIVVGGFFAVLLVLNAVEQEKLNSDVMHFSYAPAHASAPLILDLHGAGGTPTAQWAVSHMHECARTQHWHIVYPAGVDNTWNAGPMMYPPASGFADVPPTDHVKELTHLAMELRARLNASHVFVSGLSNGCAMSLRLGLEAPAGVVDGVSCTAHAMHADIRAPQPTVPRPLLLLTGTDDPVFASDDAVNRTLHEWMLNNGCSGTLNAASTIGDTTMRDASPCAEAVQHVAFQGAGHLVPLSRAGAMQCSFFEHLSHATD